jgi:hypothetical protein
VNFLNQLGVSIPWPLVADKLQVVHSSILPLLIRKIGDKNYGGELNQAQMKKRWNQLFSLVSKQEE